MLDFVDGHVEANFWDGICFDQLEGMNGNMSLNLIGDAGTLSSGAMTRGNRFRSRIFFHSAC